MTGLSVRRAAAADRPLAERLWLMFRHDMSEFGGQLPNPDGTFRSTRLDAAFEDPDWAAYVFFGQPGQDPRPVGFALVRGLSGPVRVLNSFFVVRAARRSGTGLRAVRAVTAEHPGRWQVAFQDANAGAVRFWRRVAADIAGDDWRQERRAVPNRPDLSPDVWISFRSASPDHARIES